MKTGTRVILRFAALALVCHHPATADNWSTGTTGVISSGSSSRVGVGNGSPSSQLHVSSNSSNREALNVNQVQGSPAIARFLQNGTTRMLITAAGQVGIGTTSPARTLDVAGSVRAASIEGNGIFPVTAFGVIPNDTLTNYTTQFRNAIAAAAAVGGTVYVPPGQYTINDPLTIPQGVTLQGSWEGPHEGVLTRGTTLRTATGHGNIGATPFITIDSNATLAGVTIFYPNQNPTSPVPYSWTIRGGSNVNIINTTLANSYQGIQFVGWHVRHLLRGINMTALLTGISLDRCTDIGRLENVHIHADIWRTTGRLSEAQYLAVRQFNEANLTGFRIGRVDWEYIIGCFVIWARNGFHFVQGGDVPGVMQSNASIQMVNSGADGGFGFGMRVEYSQRVQGLMISNSVFTGHVQIDATNEGPIKFNNCNFIQLVEPQDLLIQKDGNGVLHLDNCSFSLHLQQNDSRGAIEIFGGAAHISNVDFVEPTPKVTAIRARPGSRVNVSNGVFRGNGILNEGGTMNISGVMMGGSNWGVKSGIVNTSVGSSVGRMNLVNIDLGGTWISDASPVNQANVLP